MSRPRDPSHMSAEPTPTAAELEASERLFADLRSGDLEFTSDPTLRLLRSARGPATPHELIGAADFAEHAAVAAAAVRTGRGGGRCSRLSARPDGSGRPGTRGEGSADRRDRVLGVAGAGAATGVIIASNQQSEPSTTAVLPSSTVASTPAEPATPIPGETAVVPTSTTVTTPVPPGPAKTGPTLPEPRAGGTPLDRPGRASSSTPTPTPTTVVASSGGASAVAPAIPAGAPRSDSGRQRCSQWSWRERRRQPHPRQRRRRSQESRSRREGSRRRPRGGQRQGRRPLRETGHRNTLMHPPHDDTRSEP